MWNDGAIAMDWRGIPRAIYDELGREIWRVEFGPFGEPLYERGVVSNTLHLGCMGCIRILRQVCIIMSGGIMIGE